MSETKATFSGAQADAVGRLIAEIDKLKAQRDAALAEVERLRVVELPEITWEMAQDFAEESTLIEPCQISTIPSLWSWTQEAVDFVALINKERSK